MGLHLYHNWLQVLTTCPFNDWHINVTQKNYAKYSVFGNIALVCIYELGLCAWLYIILAGGWRS